MTAFVDEWVSIATDGGIGRIVLNIGGTPGPATAHPFFAELHAMQDRVSQSGLPYVILQPTVYLAAPWAAEGLAAGVTGPIQPRRFLISYSRIRSVRHS
ncbi:hypothetical protein [Pseudaestuariivita rosea]|uniref:hypothetical protein n=1 Tax=Pseudaestuariivita rosea TaxID=2763263 RepID=UPI001ABA5B43|nr:hypothetical protein [Pseudaestuariivita rosea]